MEKQEKGRAPETPKEAIEALSQFCANVDNSVMGLHTPTIVAAFMKEIDSLKALALSGLKEDSDLKAL